MRRWRVVSSSREGCNLAALSKVKVRVAAIKGGRRTHHPCSGDVTCELRGFETRDPTSSGSGEARMPLRAG